MSASVNAIDIFTSGPDVYSSPPITPADVTRAELSLGLRLPETLRALLLQRNGGMLRRKKIVTAFPPSWANDHFMVDGLRGIGGEWGFDPGARFGGSPFYVEQWGYPKVGICIGIMPSAGHDALMLDFKASGSLDEPSVIYVDEDRLPKVLAPNFTSFLHYLASDEPGGV